MTKEEATKQLFEAAIDGDLSAAQSAIEAGANVNAKDEHQRTPLHWAAEHHFTYLPLLLIEQGADVNAKDKRQQTALHVAAQNGHANLAQRLIEKGADVNARNELHRTPRYLAEQRGLDDVSTVLTEALQKQKSHAGRISRRSKASGSEIGG